MEQQFSNIEECNDYIEFLEIKCKPIPKWVMTEKERIENGKEGVSINSEGSINKHAKVEVQNNSVEKSKQF